MNENKTSCAPADNQQTLWDRIDWTKAELAVRKLQARIVKAQKEGRYNKVKALQWTLTHSFYAKALAVKRVTSNGGGNTPGVDMETWEKPEAKTQAISELKRRGYQPMPLRRVHIKKSNGKLRPLGIPTMKDRAMQALYLMALEPVSETTADSRSYGFRKERRCMDAVMQCHNILRKGRRAFENWTTRTEADLRGQVVKFLDSVMGPNKLIERFKVMKIEQDPNQKDRVLLDIHITPYFPAKSFVIQLAGHKGDNPEDAIWESEYHQE